MAVLSVVNTVNIFLIVGSDFRFLYVEVNYYFFYNTRLQRF